MRRAILCDEPANSPDRAQHGNQGHHEDEDSRPPGRRARQSFPLTADSASRKRTLILPSGVRRQIAGTATLGCHVGSSLRNLICIGASQQNAQLSRSMAGAGCRLVGASF